MLMDFLEYGDAAPIDTDICLVGSGAAGITLAKELMSSRRRVLLLESGGAAQEPDTQQLYDSEVVGLHHKSIHDGRVRVFGGTTTLWGGQAVRHFPIDFRARPWVPLSGWPLDFGEMEPYYQRAKRVLQLGQIDEFSEMWRNFGVRPPAYDPAKLQPVVTEWSPAPNFAQAYREELRHAPNVTVLLHANAVKINVNAQATHADGVEIRALSGKQGKVRARHVVLCCGGIENPRLLLASRDVVPEGLGNQHDQVGRYFQEHIHMRPAKVHPTDRQRLCSQFDLFYFRGCKFYHRTRLSEKAQEDHQLLNIAGDVLFDQPEDSSIEAAKALLRGVRSKAPVRELVGAVPRVLRHPGDVARLGYRFTIQKRSCSPSRGPIWLSINCESAPNPDSRVTLSRECDALGVPRARLDWRVSPLERKTIQEFTRIVDGEFRRLQLGHLEVTPEVSLEGDDWTRLVRDLSHHIGTTRMADDPRLGVVDRHCGVHGMDNLYLAGTSVMPTSGFSNPTLTLMALGARLADRLAATS